MVLTLGDLDLLKQLRGAGASGRNVRELNIRVTLDRYSIAPARRNRQRNRHNLGKDI
jgi:hypothetical protein